MQPSRRQRPPACDWYRFSAADRRGSTAKNGPATPMDLDRSERRGARDGDRCQDFQAGGPSAPRGVWHRCRSARQRLVRRTEYASDLDGADGRLEPARQSDLRLVRRAPSCAEGYRSARFSADDGAARGRWFALRLRLVEALALAKEQSILDGGQRRWCISTRPASGCGPCHCRRFALAWIRFPAARGAASSAPARRPSCCISRPTGC